jgi:hypothetical protein
VKVEPALLYHHGRYLDVQMKRTRLPRPEVEAAVREKGHLSMDNDIIEIIHGLLHEPAPGTD